MKWLLRFISARHLLDAPLRTGLTVVGVALGVATLVGITSINRAVFDAFRSTVDTVAGKADLSVGGAVSGFDEALLEQIRAVEGVEHAAGTLTVIAPVKARPGESVYVIGIDFLDDGYFRSYQSRDTDVAALNNDLEFLNSTDRLLLSSRYAAQHALRVGDSLELMTSEGAKPFVVHGLLDDSGPAAAFGGAVAVMFFASAQQAFGRGAVFDRVDVKTAPGVGFEVVRDRLRALLGPGFDIDRPDRRGQSVETMLRSFQLGLNLGSGVALLVGVFLVYNTVSIGVVQRRREIGTLRALGATRRAIRWLFSLEAMLLGLLGSALGIPFGLLLARSAIGAVSESVSSLYVRVNATQVTLRPSEVVTGVLMGVIGSMLAALWPAAIASGVAPVEALRKDAAGGAGLLPLRSWPTAVGVLLWLLVWPLQWIPPPVENLALGGYLAIFAAVMGLALLSPQLLRVFSGPYAAPAQALLGITGRLAADNFGRAPLRTAVPISALAIGTSMAVAITGFISSFQVSAVKWIEESIPADLFCTSSSKLAGTANQPMAPELGEQLKALPGVEAVDPVRLYQHDLLGLRVYLTAIDFDVYQSRAKLTVLAGTNPTLEQRKAGWVTISENLALRRNLKPGDELTISTPTGEKRYPIGAVIVDYTSDQGVVVLERSIFVRDFQDDRVDSFHVYVQDKAQLEAVRQRINERFGAQYNLYVLSNAELRQEALGLIDRAFSVTTAMEIVAILLALLGVVNTLLAAVIDRTREIGLLRALGAARAHVTKLFAAEAALIGFTGGLFGVALGGVTGALITIAVNRHATGWAFPYHYPWAAALQVIAIASVCSVLAGLYPARRAATLDVVEALAWE